MFKDILDRARKEGVAHFRFWFQPIDRFISASPDSYLSWNDESNPLKELSPSKYKYGKGYLTIDPSSKPFIDNKILWIPALYYSDNGKILDLKVPLQKSIEKMQMIPKVEIEQPFYLIDRELVRGDLAEIGRRVYHFSESITVDETRVSLFLNDLKKIVHLRGIDVEIEKIGNVQFVAKIRADESLFIVDQNIQLMEIIKKLAFQNQMAALFSEKPFQDQMSSEKKIRLTLNVGTDVIRNGLIEHESFIKAALCCFNFEARLTGVEPTIVVNGNDVVIMLSAAAHPSLILCAIIAAVTDWMQLPKNSQPVVSQSSSPFTDSKTLRAFSFLLDENELISLQEMCIAKYVTSMKRYISLMNLQFNDKILPLLMTKDLSFRATIEQEIVEIEEMLSQINDFGLEMQAKVLSELGVSKILKAKSRIDEFMNHFRI